MKIYIRFARHYTQLIDPVMFWAESRDHACKIMAASFEHWRDTHVLMEMEGSAV